MSETTSLPMDKRRVRWVMVALVLGMLLGALDMTIVSTAMPGIVSELGGLTYYSWVFSAYMLTSTLFVPIFGKLSDLFGRRLVYQIGLGAFILGSALCGFSSNMVELILFRALQGIGGAALMPIAMVIIGDLYPPTERGKIQGMFGAVFGLASVGGPALGGLISDYLSWEWVFWINLPLGVAGMIVIALSLQETKGEGKRYIDFWGAGLLMAGMSSLLLALIMGGVEFPWNSPVIIGLFLASVLFTIVFVYVQTKVPEPIIPLQLFHNRVFNVSVSVGFLLGAAMFGAVSYIPLYVQGVIGVNASLAGYILTPLMLAMILGSVIAGRLIKKVSYRTFALFGMVLLSLSFYLLSQLSVDTPMYAVVLYMILAGFGMGPLNPVLTIAVQNEVDSHMRGIATSSLQFFRSIGGTVGVTVMGVFLNHNLAGQLKQITGQVPASAVPLVEKFSNPQLLLSPDVRNNVPPEILLLLEKALAYAVDTVFLVSLFISIIGIAASVLYGKSKISDKQVRSA